MTAQIIFTALLFGFMGLVKLHAIKRERENTRHQAGLKAWNTRQLRYRTILIKEGDRVVERLTVKTKQYETSKH